MDSFNVAGGSLPIYASGPVYGLYVVLLVMLMRRTSSRAAKFVLFAVGVRLMLSGLHEFTYQSSPAGLSYNALGSVLIFGIGLLVVRWRKLSDPTLVPFYPLLAVMITSAFVNHQVPALTTALTKFGYLIVLIMAVVDAAEDEGPDKLFGKLILVFTFPFVLQVISFVLGVSKPGETDGATSWIGGFHHEGAFSLTLAAGVLAACLAQSVPLRLRMLVMFLGVAGIVLANYRTSILGVLPLIGVALLVGVPRRFVAEQRGLVLGFMFLVAAAALSGAVLAGQERFSDLEAAAASDSVLIQPKGDFSTEQRRVMSGRPYIWSGYIYAWVNADAEQKLIGAGAETWPQTFDLYAHNTLVSSLYEIGVVGVFAVLFLWGSMLWLALLAKGWPRPELVAAHLSFFVLNQATMPMWLIEGLILYGMLCGYTIYCFKHRHVSRARPISAERVLC